MRPILLVGGSPRVRIDAVRYLSVHASGQTAVTLAQALRGDAFPADLLLSTGASPDAPALRYEDRAQLEQQLQAWIAVHPDGVVVLSAAINDYQLAEVATMHQGTLQRLEGLAKVPSGADEMIIRMRPASKVIDQLRGWGLTGSIIGFKYESRATVIRSAQALCQRVGAALVVANSLCGSVQALVDAQGVVQAADRADLLEQLRRRVATLAKS